MSSSWIHGLYLKVLTLNWISTESGYGKGTKDGVGSGIKWGKYSRMNQIKFVEDSL